MPTSAPGSRRGAPPAHSGFTLLELMVTVAIIAIATAGVSFALRDSGDAQLEREGLRLAALLEAGRAQSRTTGIPVTWQPVEGGFRFNGVLANSLPDRWLVASTRVVGSVSVQLGPEPIIAPQAVVLVSSEHPDRTLRVATDGLRPFSVRTQAP